MLDHQQPEQSPTQSLIEQLQEKKDKAQPASLPNRLPLEQVMEEVDIFQVRCDDLNPSHVSDLAKLLFNLNDLEPITVFQVGNEAYLVDGHHRIAAYKKAGKKDIPVEYLPEETTVKEAMAFSFTANNKTKLNLTLQQRMDGAWRLVRMGVKAYTKPEIKKLSNVSNGQIGFMRKVLDKLGTEAIHIECWDEARDLYNKREKPKYDENDIERFKREQAEKYAERMRKEFHDKLFKNPEVAAMALDMHFGERLVDLFRALQEYIPEEELEGPGF
ncbi:ParB N-terminal domain-containing protein [Terasakiella pusilla]|uniref:ParB N-terminal domain-containing protein n=1 Tax=Terasakiella pusilla TaxID=64973 RepID=UPI003AA90F9A